MDNTVEKNSIRIVGSTLAVYLFIVIAIRFFFEKRSIDWTFNNGQQLPQLFVC